MAKKTKAAGGAWSAIGGLSAARDRLIETLVSPLTNPGACARLGIRSAHGFLLYGPPGVGKTLLARTAAAAAGARFIGLSAPDLLSRGADDADALLRGAFADAAGAGPAILFLNELELIAPQRAANMAEPQRSERLVNLLLAEIDRMTASPTSMFIGATSRPNVIDPALLRPGRLDELIYAPVPDAAGRAEILAIMTTGVALADDVDLEDVARTTERFTAADYDDLIRRAGLRALRRSVTVKAVTAADISGALDETRASVTEAMEKEYEKVQGEIKANALKLEPMGFFGPGQLKPVRGSKHGAEQG
jgi:transitional endoplasmic reticulum ATPase